MLTSIPDLMRLIDSYVQWLEARGCRFDDFGFPIPERSWYLTSWPDMMVTYRERNASFVECKNKTVLCFFCDDRRIYPRLENVLGEIAIYREFMGVVSADVTVTADMDIELQELTMLVNQLFLAILGISGVKVEQNTRIGSQVTLRCLRSVPKNILCASGTLGCDATENSYDMRYAEKLFMLRPSGVLMYGKGDRIMESQLDNAGVPFRLYKDTHTMYKNRSAGSLRAMGQQRVG